MRDKKIITMFAPYMAEDAITQAAAILKSCWIGQGPFVDKFEKEVEKTLGIHHAVAVNCSSSALRLALDLCGVGPGDEVITTPLTCTITNHPILEQYATPVFADIQLDTGNIDPSDIEKRITHRTKAIMCTHWAGYPCDLDELNRVGERHGLPIIEDASEAFGASYRGRPIGAISRFTVFSFQAIQIITTGEGGMLVASTERDADQARIRRWYGIDRNRRKPNSLGYYDFDITSVGYGYHLTDISASIGIANLASLPMRVKRRREIALSYREAFGRISGIRLLNSVDDRQSSNPYFMMHVNQREEFCRMMSANGIQVSIVHHRNDAYSVFGGLRSDLPQLDRFARTYIGLPVHTQLTDDDTGYIIRSVQSGW